MLNFTYHLRCIFLSCLLLCYVGLSYAQNDTLANPLTIDKLIKDQSINEAKKELHKQITYFKSQKNYDTLP